jgi:hypothetical protein
MISDLPIIHNKDVKLKDENKKQLWTTISLPKTITGKYKIFIN